MRTYRRQKGGEAEEIGREGTMLMEDKTKAKLIILLPSVSMTAIFTVELNVSWVSKLWPAGRILPPANFCQFY